MEPLYCDRQMGRKGVISSHATLYSRRECKRPTQIAARSAAPISRETPPPYLEPCANELFWVLVDRFIKGVAERRFTKHTCGSLHFLALRFIKKKFGTQMEIDSGTFSFFWGLGGPSEPIKVIGIYCSILWHTEGHLNWKNGTSYTLHQAILVQFGRNRDYETVCWETTHPDKLYNFRFTAIQSY